MTKKEKIECISNELMEKIILKHDEMLKSEKLSEEENEEERKTWHQAEAKLFCNYVAEILDKICKVRDLDYISLSAISEDLYNNGCIAKLKMRCFVAGHFAIERDILLRKTNF